MLTTYWKGWLAMLLIMLVARIASGEYALMDNTMVETIPFIAGAASVVRGNVVYRYGGVNREQAPYTNTFTQTSLLGNGALSFQFVKQNNSGPLCSFSQAVLLPDNQTMLLLGGDNPVTANASLMAYRYRFDTASWSPAPILADNGTLPVNRKRFTATLAPNGKVYIYGGVQTLSDAAAANIKVLNDFWSYDPVSGQFRSLTQQGQPAMYSHVGIAFQSGIIAYITGAVQYPNGVRRLLFMNQTLMYDSNKNMWGTKILGGQLPSTRANANAVLAPDGASIIVFGGDNGAIAWETAFSNQLAVLDSNTSNWTIIDPQGIPPRRRSFATAGLVNDKYLMVIGGNAGPLYMNDVNVLELPEARNGQWAWVTNIYQQQSASFISGLSGGAIAGIVIGSIVLASIILLCLWRFWTYIRWLIVRIHRDIWQPRTGEPIWAETTRLVCQFILFFLFVAFFAFVIYQVIHSPNSTITISEPSSTVRTPDVRFCFDGWNNSAAVQATAAFPRVSCMTDGGYSCTRFIRQLDMSYHQPWYADQLGPVTCYLYAPPSSFLLGNTVDLSTNNGSQLIFYLWGNATVYGRVHTSVYPPRMDPNMAYYFNDTSQLISPQQGAAWLNNDRNDISATNIFDIEPGTYSTINYQIQNHRYLEPTGWNYVGFLPQLNSTPEIVSEFRQEAPNPGMLQPGGSIVGSVYVTPSAYVDVTLRETKIYSLVNAIGFIGGVFGIFVAFQAWMFGYRPRSPWGIVHRWSVGDMRRSISRGLINRFDLLRTPVPLVNPVHRRFSMFNIKSYGHGNDPDEEDALMSPMSPNENDDHHRLDRMEERLQLMELLFKSYYIDDEVFRTLDRALKEPEKEVRKRNSSSEKPRKRWSKQPFIKGTELNDLGEQNNNTSSSRSASKTPPPLPDHASSNEHEGPGSQQRLLDD
ncbi:hypothetical protein EC973_009588 [Apophysomyces ossiformis]|uniref:Attractin/MKLN-like beta-propeller domain-containing protein n=1 Tax=Apophysomyces ossiformis TaxID=679940 RepID=A0A8H7BVG6_9FUNG|nr:hypothetical protein EC973_009588 [Apophysomyces ossiformis]